MRKSRNITRLNADSFASIDGIRGDLRLDFGPRAQMSSMISTELQPLKPKRRMSSVFSGTPSWCQVAFMFERERNRKEPTDWSFVLPVWIAIALFCSLVQIVAFQSIYSVFA
ncbi:MAG: hypothetical protein AAGL97_03170 [Pseudomonadota bacterium]